MNTVSLNKTRTLTAVRVASLLALAALAIAFFAFPFASYAMGCKGGGKGKGKNNNGVAASTKVAGTVTFSDLMQDAPGATTSNSAKVVDPTAQAPAVPFEKITLITPDQVQQTGMFVWNWVKGTDNAGKEVYGTIADTKGDVWLTNGVLVKLTGLNGIKIQPAPKNAQP
jgi:hypothetical protein